MPQIILEIILFHCIYEIQFHSVYQNYNTQQKKAL